ncbi:MAG: glycosyltransferase family 4 protein [Kiritimatiellae bacterium]|nr:glycosyltransferase family 4 protein [Kiritimatiellia bacterium]MCO5068216.1 glycosyltransferase family 4 protein [Kiritimatiellia bacterium]
MKIAYLCPNYQDQRGGAEVMTYHLAEELTKRGHQVDIYAAQTSDRAVASNVRLFKRWKWVEQIAKWILGLERKRGFYRAVQVIRRDGRIPLLAHGPYCPAIRRSKTYSLYDVVFLVGFYSVWVWLLPRRLRPCLLVGIPLFHVHEETATRRVHNRFHRKCDRIVTLTDFEKSYLMGRGWDGNKIETIGVGSESSCPPVSGLEFRKRFGVESSAPLVLLLGRKIFNKGIVHLIQAMDIVWDTFPAARLALVGFSCNSAEWLRGHLAKCSHDANSRVINLDNASEADREGALAACDLMALPSISDSFGIAYLDAWRHKKPVIGCLRTSSESVIDAGRDGLLVEFGDVGALAADIGRLIGDKLLREQMGRAGYDKWNSQFRWEVIAERTEMLLWSWRSER